MEGSIPGAGSNPRSLTEYPRQHAESGIRFAQVGRAISDELADGRHQLPKGGPGPRADAESSDHLAAVAQGAPPLASRRSEVMGREYVRSWSHGCIDLRS